MPVLESKVSRKIIETIWSLFSIAGCKLQLDQHNGYPDLIFWVPRGKPFLVEVKRPGEETRPLQDSVHQKLKRLGYTVHVCDNHVEAAIKMSKFLVAQGFENIPTEKEIRKRYANKKES